MKNYIKQIFDKLFCLHNWKHYHRSPIYKYSDSEFPSEVYDTLICTKCGKIKRIKL